MLTLLGPPSASVGGRATPWPSTRPAALLAFLACRRDWVTRDELAFLMRPDASDQEARRYLRQLLHRAVALPFAEGVELGHDRVRWDVASDLGELRTAIDHADAAGLLRHPPADLLAGYEPVGLPAFADWLALEREHVREAWRSAVVALALERERAGDDAGAAQAREAVLRVDPLDETTLQACLHAYLRCDAPERVLHAFERFSRSLLREVGAEPLDATLALADAAKRALASRSAASSRVDHDALPLPTTPFVGREREVERIVGWLGRGVRLVGIVGLGGVGKSRLALEVARRVRTGPGAPPSYVALAGAHDVEQALAAVAARLGVRAGGTGGAAGLAAALGSAPRLLVLDELEHLPLAACAEALVTLVSGATGLQVLFTSRVPLGVDAEHLVRLGGLSVDDGEAVALFDDRTIRAGVELPADDATRHVVRAICTAVDGFPLALELAAVRAGTVPLRVLHDELARGADVLRTDALDVPDRHRSVTRLIERAWAALDAPERAVLSRLCVFGAEFGLDAAERVAGADLGTLTTLLARSLLRRVGSERYEVVSLVRRGAPAPPDEATQDRHARHTLAWLAELGPALTGGPEQARAVARVHLSLDDVRRAWLRAVAGAFAAAGTAERDGMLAALDAVLEPLDHALHARTLWGLAATLYGALVGAAEGDRRSAAARLRARARVRLANVERQLGLHDAARDRLRAVLDAQGGTDPGGAEARTTLEAYVELASLDEVAGDYAAAARGLRTVLAVADPIRDRDLLVRVHSSLGSIAFALGESTDVALEHAETAVDLAREVGDGDLLSVALVNLGAAYHDIAELPAARRAWREAASLAGALGHPQREAVVTANLGAIAEELGDVAAAREAYERSLALRRSVGDRVGEGRVLLHLGRLRRLQGDLEAADATVEAAVRVLDDHNAPADLALAQATLARLRVEQGDLRGARRATAAALALARRIGERVALLTALLAEAAVAFAEGRRALAVEVAEAVLNASAGREAGVHASARAFLERAGADRVDAAVGPSAPPPSGPALPLEALADAAIERHR